MSDNNLKRSKYIPNYPPLTWDEMNQNWKYIDDYIQREITGFNGVLRAEYLGEERGNSYIKYKEGSWKFYYRKSDTEIRSVELLPNTKVQIGIDGESDGASYFILQRDGVAKPDDSATAADLSYNSMVNIPKINSSNTTVLTAEQNEELKGTINLHKVVKTGSYADLNNKPEIPEVADSLDSESATAALSANQGKVLDEKKVDKENGKGLSSNDYTDEDKSKVELIQKDINKENLFLAGDGVYKPYTEAAELGLDVLKAQILSGVGLLSGYAINPETPELEKWYFKWEEGKEENGQWVDGHWEYAYRLREEPDKTPFSVSIGTKVRIVNDYETAIYILEEEGRATQEKILSSTIDNIGILSGEAINPEEEAAGSITGFFQWSNSDLQWYYSYQDMQGESRIIKVPSGTKVRIVTENTAEYYILQMDGTHTEDTDNNNGSGNTFTIGTVTTVDSGQPASVTNSGSGNNIVLDFSIPRGTQGKEGNAGTPGVPGAPGVDGTSAHLHIRWCATATEGPLLNVPNEYIGIVSTDSPAVPSKYSDYTWYKYKGDAGPQGDSGVYIGTGTPEEKDKVWILPDGNMDTLPERTSQLINDSNYVTADMLPTRTSQLLNDSSYATTAMIPSRTSQLTNDSSYATTGMIPSKTSQLTNDSSYATTNMIPGRTGQLVNDSGFVTGSNAASIWVGTQAQYDAMTKNNNTLYFITE